MLLTLGLGNISPIAPIGIINQEAFIISLMLIYGQINNGFALHLFTLNNTYFSFSHINQQMYRIRIIPRAFDLYCLIFIAFGRLRFLKGLL